MVDSGGGAEPHEYRKNFKKFIKFGHVKLKKSILS